MTSERCHAPGECFCSACCLEVVKDNLCNYVSKSSFPPLPSGVTGPFSWSPDHNWVYGTLGGRPVKLYLAHGASPEFLAAVLNVVYPA